MLNNKLSSRFTRGIYSSPIHAQVPEFTPGELLHACRNDIDSRVNVSVVSRPALGAIPLPDIKPQFIELVTATATGLARWKPSINGNQSTSIPLAFVLQLPPNLSPSRIGNMPCESGVLNHIFYFQVFDANHVEVSNQSGGQLVRLILALVPDFRMSLGDSQPLTFAALAAFLLSAQCALLLAKVTESAVVFLRILYFFSVAQRGKVSQAQVNPDYLIGDREDINLNRGAERYVILAVGFSLESNHFRASGTGKGFSDFDSANLRELNSSFCPTITTNILEPKASRYVALFEFWESRLFASFYSTKEIGKGPVLITKRLHQARRWGFGKPTIPSGFFEIRKATGYSYTGNSFFPSLVCLDSGFKRPVPNPPRTTKPVIEFANLCAIWVGANLIASLYSRHVRILHHIKELCL